MPQRGRVVVIGSGAAGRAAARSLAARGWEVIIAEESRIGGTCLWHGCIPKKALYTSAQALGNVRRSVQFGVACNTLSLDWQEALAWKWHAQETFAGDQRALLEARGIRVLQGRARFVSDCAVEVGLEPIEFDHAIIATGARPSIPELCGCELADTSDDALGYPDLPHSLTIVGAGFIALEMAGIFASLGSKVRIIQRGERILPMLDADLAEIARLQLAELGVGFVDGTTVTAIERKGSQLVVRTAALADGAESTHVCDRVLMATGRLPAISSLRLAEAGIDLDEGGRLRLTNELQTTNPKVWACGDVTGSWMHTPVASLEGRLVADSIDGGEARRPDYSCVPVTCFTLPQLATVGLSEADVASQGLVARVTRVRAGDVGAAIVDDSRDSFYKLLTAEKDGRILGGQIAGPNAGDSIYSIAVAIRGRMTVRQLRDVPSVHPSFAEGVFFSAW